MSNERRRAREAREAARRAEVERAAAQRARQERRAALRARATPSLPRRRRRYGSLSNRALSQVVIAFLVVQAAFWFVFPSYRTRLGLAVVSLAFTLVLVRSRERSPR